MEHVIEPGNIIISGYQVNPRLRAVYYASRYRYRELYLE
jgi:hypothetical protein